MPSTDRFEGFLGFITPVYSDDEIPGREARHALTPEDFRQVAEGYACPACMARFSTYRPTCMICGHQRNLSEDIVRAHDWEAAERHREKASAEVRRTPRIPAHRMVERIMREQS